MKSTPAALALILLFLTPPAAEAQRRTFPSTRGPQPSAQPTSPVNERHERAKIEAQEAYQKGNHQHAVDLTSSVLRQSPRDDVALYLRASARIELGKRSRDTKLIRDGIADSRQALSIKGSQNTLYYLPYLYGMTALAELENRTDHAQVAVTVADKALSGNRVTSDEQAQIRYQRALAQLALGKTDEAIADFQRATQASSKHMGALLALADAYARAGRVREATTTFDRAVRNFADAPLAFNNRGMHRQRQRDFAGAIADFGKAVQLDRDFFVGYTNRGFARLEQGDPRGAERDFSQSLTMNPAQNSVYSLRGTARLAQGRTDAALEDFNALAKLEPQNALAHADVGFALFFAGDYPAAHQSFNRAAELNADLRYLNPWRFWSLARSGAAKEDLDQFASKLPIVPEQTDWIDRLVAYLGGTATEEELLAALDTANSRLRTDQLCEAHFFMGQREAQAGRQKEAGAHFEKALATESRHLSAFRGAQFALKRFPLASTQGNATPST